MINNIASIPFSKKKKLLSRSQKKKKSNIRRNIINHVGQKTFISSLVHIEISAHFSTHVWWNEWVSTVGPYEWGHSTPYLSFPSTFPLFHTIEYPTPWPLLHLSLPPSPFSMTPIRFTHIFKVSSYDVGS